MHTKKSLAVYYCTLMSTSCTPSVHAMRAVHAYHLEEFQGQIDCLVALGVVHGAHQIAELAVHSLENNADLTGRDDMR